MSRRTRSQGPSWTRAQMIERILNQWDQRVPWQIVPKDLHGHFENLQAALDDAEATEETLQSAWTVLRAIVVNNFQPASFQTNPWVPTRSNPPTLPNILPPANLLDIPEVQQALTTAPSHAHLAAAEEAQQDEHTAQEQENATGNSDDKEGANEEEAKAIAHSDDEEKAKATAHSDDEEEAKATAHSDDEEEAKATAHSDDEDKATADFDGSHDEEEESQQQPWKRFKGSRMDHLYAMSDAIDGIIAHFNQDLANIHAAATKPPAC